jgi:hypothetical protein
VSAKGQDSSLAASPSPLGTSVYPDQGLGARGDADLTASGAVGSEQLQANVMRSLVVRRPISPEEYQG